MNRKPFVPYPYPAEIDKETLTTLPRAQADMPIHLITRPDQVPRAVEVLQQADAIGIDTETKPSFIPGKRTQVALLQLSTDSECFLFRLNRIGLPPALVSILEDDRILKIGLSLRDDCTALRRISPFEPQGMVELQQLCPGYGIRAASLQKVYGIVFGGYISKSQRMSNWEARDLTPQQLSYAALDAWASLRIYRRLLEHPDPTPTQFALL